MPKTNLRSVRRRSCAESVLLRYAPLSNSSTETYQRTLFLHQREMEKVGPIQALPERPLCRLFRSNALILQGEPSDGKHFVPRQNGAD
jgi:hypothetical protein